MKINTAVNGKDISITLTKEQLIEINKQTKNIKTIDDINSYEDACNILGESILHLENTIIDSNDGEYELDEEEVASIQLKIIIKAVNFIDNGNKIWKVDFLNKSLYKYIPYFERFGSGWSFRLVSYCRYTSFCSVGFYYKEEKSAEIISKRFNKLYNLVLGV